MVTDQGTGSGGRLYTMEFTGRVRFAGTGHTLPYSSLQSNSAAQERDGVTETLRLGLVPYAAQTPLAPQLRVTFEEIDIGAPAHVGGNYQRINDQLGLPRGDASLEDILLQRRQLATTYRSSLNVGLSYTFGSIFTNVVNPRF